MALAGAFSLKGELARFWQGHCDMARKYGDADVRPLRQAVKVASAMASESKENIDGIANHGQQCVAMDTRESKRLEYMSNGNQDRRRSPSHQWSRINTRSMRRQSRNKEAQLSEQHVIDGATRDGIKTCEEKRARSCSVPVSARDKKRRRSFPDHGSQSLRREMSRWDVKDTHATQQNVQDAYSSQSAYCKKRREIYVYNLREFTVSKDMLQEELMMRFELLPEFRERYAGQDGVIRWIRTPARGNFKFFFVEFCDDVLASTALLFQGFQLYGKSVMFQRPHGYVAPLHGDALPLDVTALTNRIVEVAPELPAKAVPLVGRHCTRDTANAASILHISGYFGSGDAKTKRNALGDVLLKACTQLPAHEATFGDPVVSITMMASGRLAFVKFKSESIASKLNAILDGYELFGCKLRVKLAEVHTEPNFYSSLPPNDLASTEFLGNDKSSKGASPQLPNGDACPNFGNKP